MARERKLGKVVPVDKIWLSLDELAAYIGLDNRAAARHFNKNEKVRKYELSQRTHLYDRADVDKYLLSQMTLIVMTKEKEEEEETEE